jgi:hypothetical protein
MQLLVVISVIILVVVIIFIQLVVVLLAKKLLLHVLTRTSCRTSGLTTAANGNHGTTKNRLPVGIDQRREGRKVGYEHLVLRLLMSAGSEKRLRNNGASYRILKVSVDN